MLSLNGLNDSGTIYPGQVLQLRKSSEDTLVASAENVSGDFEVSAEQPVLIINEDEELELGDTSSLFVNRAVVVDSSAAAIEPDSQEDAQQLLVDLESDPSDYTVLADNTIEIQAAETLGHYADWLGIRAWDIRRLNDMVYRQPVIIGERLKMDFSKIDIKTFEQQRRQFHRDLQASYFQNWRIIETEQHSIRRGLSGESGQERSVPMWLFRQYNPEVDAGRIQIGQVVVFPIVERVEI